VKQLMGFLILTGAAVLVACATEAPAPATGNTVNGAPTVAANAAPSSAPMRVPYGYTRVVEPDGTEVYCRYDLDTNSRVARTKVCLTAAQLAVDQQNSQDFINSVQQHGGASTQTGTPGAGAAY
jgi:hypothetical protein